MKKNFFIKLFLALTLLFSIAIPIQASTSKVGVSISSLDYD
ncbi:MAG: hypothetical protein RR601_04665 [Erysipelotrichales bacterium]